MSGMKHVITQRLALAVGAMLAALVAVFAWIVNR